LVGIGIILLVSNNMAVPLTSKQTDEFFKIFIKEIVIEIMGMKTAKYLTFDDDLTRSNL